MNAQQHLSSADVIAKSERARQPVAASRIVSGLEADPHSAQMLVDADLMILWASAGVGSLLGHDPEAVVGRPAYEFVHPEDLPMILAVTQLATTDPHSSKRRQHGSGVRQTIDARIRSHDGWMLLTMRAVAGYGESDLNAMFVMLTLPDATRTLLEAMQSVASHAPLVDSLQTLLSALSSAGDGETVGAFVDERGEIVAASRGVRVAVDPAARPWGDLATGRATWTVDVPFAGDADGTEMMLGGWTLHVLSANAAIHPVDAFVANKVASLATLAIESSNARRRLSQLARTDDLTGISNRRAFQESLAAIGHDDVVTTVILDLDRFKSVNDTHGHHVGDAALIEVARALTSSLGPHDVAARLGGDEFAALIRGSRAERADAVTRLRGRLRNMAISLPDGVLHVSASLGEAEHSGGDPLRTLRLADERLLLAKSSNPGSKSSGRGRRRFRDA